MNKKIAQHATENKPNKEENKPAELLDNNVPSGPDNAVHATPALPIDLSTIDPQKIRMAEGFGIPIGQILNWMQSVEARFNELAALNPAIKRIDEAIGQAQQARTPGRS